MSDHRGRGWVAWIFIVSVVGEILSETLHDIIGLSVGLYLPVLVYMGAKRGSNAFVAVGAAVVPTWTEFAWQSSRNEEGLPFLGLAIITMILFTGWIALFGLLGARSHAKRSEHR